MNDVMILIPTLNPDKDLMLSFVKKLKKEFKYIMVVNDGSEKEYDDFFNELDDMNIKVIENYINLGKGRSLKYAYNEILKNFRRIKYIVTADCDGQHDVKDVIACAEMTIKNPDKLVLGVRDFNSKSVPVKSKIGNKFTKWVFKVLLGLNISDTQTGLRAFSINIAKLFIQTYGERFDYETNVLIETRIKSVSIIEVPIQTIYINNNRDSHFHVVKDSLMIYQLFTQYFLTALSSFAIDLLLFWIFSFYFNIMLSTIFARVISCYYNYLTNSKFVFKKMNNNSLLKYILLVIVQMNISGLLVSGISYAFNINIVLVKILIDSIIFIANYFIQREWVFNNKDGKDEEKF